MDTFKKTLKKGLFMVLFGGMMLAISACGKEVQDAGAGQTGNMLISTMQVQEDNAGNVGNTGNAENTTDIAGNADISYENLPITYSLDNSVRAMESKSGVFTGDWDNDGAEDTLTIETKEQEGSEMIQKLELALSGCASAYIIEDADCDFIDILAGDFDGDEEAEILLLFDMRYAGANGCCGLQLLDKTGVEYGNVAEDFFTGFQYTMEVQTGENSGYLIVSDKSGEAFFIEEENVYESAIAEVTGWYGLEILEGTEQDYIRLKQYVAGDDMTDHVGDMVTVLSAGNDGLIILDEKVK
ncbi:MAG: hypothetical protein NC417_10480 [Candidatus Gastranaerophilales bacterium]|nr:hypothetical protein [Candidatus Gastranaerophilales bacterium]